MNVTQAITQRHSIRAFLDKPIEPSILTQVLETAQRTPSWANTQPWEIFVATGATLKRLKAAYYHEHTVKASGEPDIPRPTEWSDEAKKHISELHPDMVRDCGDSVEQFGPLNRDMFHAPAVVFIGMDKVLSEWSLYDIGAYSQTLMLAALENGLGSIPAITLTLFPEVLRKELGIPDNLKITIGIALGYVDTENHINRFVSRRRKLSETVRILD
jgi:nitroreductase